MRKVRTFLEFIIPTERVDVDTRDLERGFEDIVKATVDGDALQRIRSEVSDFCETKEMKCPNCGSRSFDVLTEMWVQDSLYFKDGKWFFTPDDVTAKVEGLTPTEADEVYCAECGVEIPKELLEAIGQVEWDDC